MADMLQMRGLVAAGANPNSAQSVQGTQAAQRSEAVTGQSPNNPVSAPLADELDVRPEPGVPPELPRTQLRQEAITRLEARVEALERVDQGLTALRENQPGAAEALVNIATETRGTAGAGPELAQLLARVDPVSAEAVDPGILEGASEEVRNALSAARGSAATEREALSIDLVIAENAAAAQVEVDKLERSADQIRRQEADGEPLNMLEALRGPAISRSRVVELLVQ